MGFFYKFKDQVSINLTPNNTQMEYNLNQNGQGSQADLISVNSISGGKTSAYLTANYKADYNIFSLVTTHDKRLKLKDQKLRQIVSDKLGREFIGTLEDDIIINTILELEQFIGQKIHWTCGLPFETIIKAKGGYLPNKMARYCTTELKTMPILYFVHDVIKKPVKMAFGYRANEKNRAKKMLSKCEDDGFIYQKATFSKNRNGTNKWTKVKYMKPFFPLIENNIYKDQIEKFWLDKNVTFAKHNNCVGCFWRNEIFLKKMSVEQPKTFDWFARQERINNSTFRTGITYDKIKRHKLQIELNLGFSECDTGYCGL